MNADLTSYLDTFHSAAQRLDKQLLAQKQLEVSTGIVLDSVCLKLYKRKWTNDLNAPLDAEARIFFSIWLNKDSTKTNRLHYNIHAFKLRKLKGYAVAARVFADSFRKQFKRYQDNWEHVSVQYGPLTLMEGWTELDTENLEDKIVSLANNFIAIDFLIDQSLSEFEIRKG